MSDAVSDALRDLIERIGQQITFAEDRIKAALAEEDRRFARMEERLTVVQALIGQFEERLSRLEKLAGLYGDEEIFTLHKRIVAVEAQLAASTGTMTASRWGGDSEPGVITPEIADYHTRSTP